MAQNVKISELQQNTNPTGKEEFPYAKSGSNGKMTLDTIKKFVGNGGGGGGSGTRTDEIFAPGTLPDSRESNIWIFTSNGMHGVEFVGNQAKVYAMATAFDIDGENTLLTTVIAPGDINMGLLNDDGNRLILLGYKSSWRIMYGINTDEGGEAFMFDPNSPEYTYDEYGNRGEQVPYFKSTTDLASGEYDLITIYSNAKGENVPFSDLKFIGMCYDNWERRYVYYPETDEYGQITVGVDEWRQPSTGQEYYSLQNARITSILKLGDGRNGPTYMYGDPLQTGTDGWYGVSGYSGDYWPNYPNSEDQFFADGNGSIGTVNDNTQFIGGNQKYISSDRYLGYGATKQIVTQYNVKGYGNPEPDDIINVPSLTRFNNEIGSLSSGKQDKLGFTPENISLKISEFGQKPRGMLYNLTWNGEAFSVSFYSNGTKAFLAGTNGFTIIDVATPYELTQQELNAATRQGYGRSLPGTYGNILLSEIGDFIIARDWNADVVTVFELSTPRDPSSITYFNEYSGVRNSIYESSGTYVWKREFDENDQIYYWNKYSCANPYEYDHATLTFVEHQGSINPYPDWAVFYSTTTEIMFSLDGTQLLYNYVSYGGGARIINLSTPFDLSTIDVNNYIQLSDGSYYGQPYEEFIFGWLYKYGYSKKNVYPSMEIIYSEPVTATPDNGVITLENPITVVDGQSGNITLKATTDTTKLFPGMEYTLFIKNNQAEINIDNDTITDDFLGGQAFNYTKGVAKFIVDTDYSFKTLYTVGNDS